MTKRLDSIIGEQDYNGLLASTDPTALVATVEITKGTTAIPAGTVLVKAGAALVPPASENGNPTVSAAATAYTPISKALTGADLVLVLSEEVPAGSGKAVVTAYKTGNFARERLHASTGYTLTASDFDYMRQAGILSEHVID